MTADSSSGSPGPALVRLGTEIDGIDVSADGRHLLVRRIGRGSKAPLVLADAATLRVLAEWGRGEVVWAVFLGDTRILCAIDTGSGRITVQGFEQAGGPEQTLFELPRGSSTATPQIARGVLALVDAGAVRVYRGADLSAQDSYPLPAGAAVLFADERRAYLREPGGVAVLEAGAAGSGRLIPVAGAERVLATRTRAWLCGEFGRGLFVAQADGRPLDAPPPFSAPDRSLTAFAVSEAEDSVLIGNASGYVQVVDAASGALRWGRRVHRGHVTAAAFAPDGRHAYCASSAGELSAIALP